MNGADWNRVTTLVWIVCEDKVALYQIGDLAAGVHNSTDICVGRN